MTARKGKNRQEKYNKISNIVVDSLICNGLFFK